MTESRRSSKRPAEGLARGGLPRAASLPPPQEARYIHNQRYEPDQQDEWAGRLAEGLAAVEREQPFDESFAAREGVTVLHMKDFAAVLVDADVPLSLRAIGFIVRQLADYVRGGRLARQQDPAQLSIGEDFVGDRDGFADADWQPASNGL